MKDIQNCTSWISATSFDWLCPSEHRWSRTLTSSWFSYNIGGEREHIFCDKLSGAKTDRTGFLLYQESLRLGDTLLVWKLDRLGRSMSHLVTMIEELKEREIGFRSISVGIIDTTTPSWELVFHVFSTLAQFERRLIQERTKAGLAAGDDDSATSNRRTCGDRKPAKLEREQTQIPLLQSPSARVLIRSDIW